MTSALKDRGVLITGASRGIGRQIALAAAEQGAAVVVAAKSDTAHAKLPGGIHSVAEEVRRGGGVALPLRLGVRDDQSIEAAMRPIDSEFDWLDALVNNVTEFDRHRHDAEGKMLALDLFVDA
ncbi:SDR family NAD(P)-dependent oxidoreductase [Hoeflea sp. WL0058]|uniref:SDR family NAD(P)-dependent oxidoreductase n=1 Tax=Flavimaribacter sediminis TaxID=2865987 RepID=A0AAE2ZJQ4_9HYPH|nr:SDR family NAD(P)-dependent oxidoreductase [Flavimaribacter sediminis]MBW8636316.1 SDR family NAD(P)-dependent oxidoreductase [Flavimaribacter sediminis]